MSIKNKLLARYLLYKYRTDASDIANCQEEIFSLGTHPHFTLYRKNELLTIFRDSGLHVDQLLYSPGTGKQHFIAQLSAK